MTNAQRLMDTLKTAGMRITHQRRVICDYLARTEEHPTAATIYDALKPGLPSLSLMTVYNTLNTLAELGAIQVLGQAGDDTVHYDADTEPHINLICIDCQKIEDYPSPYIRNLEQAIDAGSGFRIQGARVVFYGLCPECQAKRQNKSNTA
jgi:Fur family peroxide stress response transcriptional regulator